MNTSKLKTFAPAIRRQLMEAVERKLDYVLTSDTAALRSHGNQIASLGRQAERDRGALVERVAYTWFNRLAALRFLDARGWHPFKARVLTAAEDETQPEVLKLLRTGSLPEELKPFTDLGRLNDLLDGRLPTAIDGADPQGEVYHHLILAACRFYHATMPFLFEELDDETELLLPDDLLTATSVAESFRTEISDDDCSEVEILGWLYQFYISEKKDAVMARKKAVPSEDIPAVTQLFTPHWIVRYLVENSLGRLWLRSRPNSRLKEHMPYYVEDPDGQPPADSLTVATPEEIKLLDPASGSGHMLTYAFDLLVKIYEEEGHAPSEIPEKILTHNLFGLEICPRAAQLASFALVCKAREQSRRAFRSPVQPQVMCLRDVVLTPEEVKGFIDATGITLSQDELSKIHQFRENTETFGALIQPVFDAEQLAFLRAKIGEQAPAGDLLVQNTYRKLHRVLDQAEMLSQRYQVVVANPPYMGSSYFCGPLKSFSQSHYSDSKADLLSMFVEQALRLNVASGFSALVTIQNWMFLGSFSSFRHQVVLRNTIVNLVQIGYNAFPAMNSKVAQGVSFVLCRKNPREPIGSYVNLNDASQSADKQIVFTEKLEKKKVFHLSQNRFDEIPDKPIVYWLSDRFYTLFTNHDSLGSTCEARQGLITGDNNKFLRLWWETTNVRRATPEEAGPDAGPTKRWFPFNKGGDFRKWYGNMENVVDWEADGRRIKNFVDANGKLRSRPQNTQFYFRPSVSWSDVTSATNSFRIFPKGFIYDGTGHSAFPNDGDRIALIGYLNSIVSTTITKILNPTLHFHIGNFRTIPDLRCPETSNPDEIMCAVDLAATDWDNSETSWDFHELPLLRPSDWEVDPEQLGGAWKGRTLAESWSNYATYCAAAIHRMQVLETENNRLWIDAYGLQEELTPEVREEEITLARADQGKDVAAFLSYAVGCMMGRYSLDQPGLILADAGDTVENYLAKVGKPLDELQFPPDDDAIIPLLDGEWFTDDVVARTREFLRVTFGDDTLEENLRFIEEALGKDLRKYFLTDFYKDHLQTYKKRPIYWLFQSPKKGFGALVYLHRYTRDTANTLLNEYLRDFLKKLESRIEHLGHVQDTATTAREKTAATKESDKLRKILKECREWERDVLLPLAQQRLEIDLDDGVKANYPKFGKALATVPGLS